MGLSGCGIPPEMTRAVPITGRSAAVPGNGVSVSKMTAPMTIRARPAPTTTGVSEIGIRDSLATPIARAAPTASSHARAGSRKNASGASLSVQTTPSERQQRDDPDDQPDPPDVRPPRSCDEQEESGQNR
jgi:hypothetical protein